MPQKKRDPSFDAMIKFFTQKYNIATKQDINFLLAKLEKLEKKVEEKKAAESGQVGKKRPRNHKHQSASDKVLEAISDSKNGAKFDDIQAKTQFEDKKLRNIIYRLSKQGKIHRPQRGLYVPL